MKGHNVSSPSWLKRRKKKSPTEQKLYGIVVPVLTSKTMRRRTIWNDKIVAVE
jgi:hypothetical protein